jgi:hypothetical protein
MKLRRIAQFVVLLSLFVSGAVTAQKVSIGIAPVFDGGGEEFGPVVAQHLTLFAYQDLLTSATARPWLLSPGGVYSPLDTSWLVEYVSDRADINLLLVATLKPVLNPSKEHWTIPVDLVLLNAQSGATVASWSVSAAIDSHKTLLDYGQVVVEKQAENRLGHVDGKFVGAPSRDFEKQPLGKATAQLASSIRETLETKLAGLGTSKRPPQPSPVEVKGSAVSCPVNARITYAYKHSASHSYQLLANGLDQSTDLKDGAAIFSAPEGELLIQFSVNDAPYKLVKEPLYQLSTVHSCSHPNLIVDLGPSGDAHAKWE